MNGVVIGLAHWRKGHGLVCTSNVAVAQVSRVFLSSGASHELSEGGQSRTEVTMIEIPYNETRGVGWDQLKVTDGGGDRFPSTCSRGRIVNSGIDDSDKDPPELTWKVSRSKWHGYEFELRCAHTLLDCHIGPVAKLLTDIQAHAASSLFSRLLILVHSVGFDESINRNTLSLLLVTESPPLTHDAMAFTCHRKSPLTHDAMAFTCHRKSPLTHDAMAFICHRKSPLTHAAMAFICHRKPATYTWCNGFYLS